MGTNSDVSLGADPSTGIVVREFQGLCERQPDRKFQQILFDVHERIYNLTGISPECADTEEVTNRDYLNAIHVVREGRLMRSPIRHTTQESIDDAFLEDADEWCIPEHELAPMKKFSINSLIEKADALCGDAHKLACASSDLLREIIAIKHEIGEEF